MESWKNAFKGMERMTKFRISMLGSEEKKKQNINTEKE